MEKKAPKAIRTDVCESIWPLKTSLRWYQNTIEVSAGVRGVFFILASSPSAPSIIDFKMMKKS
jgi:hypothetical protein